MIETGIDLDDVIPDLPRDGRLPDGRPWPPQPGAQRWSPLWRRLADIISRNDRPTTPPEPVSRH